MNTAAADSSRAALRAALFDYTHSPGKYQVGMRQPQLLFASLREVLLMAVGRDGDAVSDVEETASLRDAARFFIRTALLYPGGDHYALLGLDRKADAVDLKDRYRLLMRLLHPDFAGPGAGAWPADAAVRVNRAYDTLSSPVQRREYDERLTAAPSAAAAPGVQPKRPRSLPQSLSQDSRQSWFKGLAIACAVASVALVVVSIFATGTSETGHLVQRARVSPAVVQVATQEPVRSVPALSEPQVVIPPTAAPAPPLKRADSALESAPQSVARALPSPVPQPAATPAPILEQIISVARGTPVTTTLQPPPAESRPNVAIAALPVVVPPPSQALPVAVSAPAVQAPPAPRPAPKPGPTLTEAQPLLSQLLQVLESGQGERILNLLDADARSKPSAVALSRQYDNVVDGARPVRVSHVEFKAEPGDGRLLVVGHFRVMAGEQTIGSLGKKMMLRAEFVSREGNVVITGLSGGPVN